MFRYSLTCVIETAYEGPLNVELSRHSHNVVDVAREAFALFVFFFLFSVRTTLR